MEPAQQTTPAPENDQQHFYFLIAGEVEYIEGKHNKTPKYLRVNMVFQSPIQGLTAAQIAKIQVDMQMNFHQRYSRTHRDPPQEITYCMVEHVSFLGVFSEKEFLDKAPTESGPDALEELAKKEPKPRKGK